MIMVHKQSLLQYYICIVNYYILYVELTPTQLLHTSYTVKFLIRFSHNSTLCHLNHQPKDHKYNLIYNSTYTFDIKDIVLSYRYR